MKQLGRIGKGILHFFYQIWIFILFEFRLRPRIMKMKDFVTRIAYMKQDLFPQGKSLFVFPSMEDTLYFIIYKEEQNISVTEVYDDILNKIPESYQLLPRIPFSSILNPV